MNEPAADPPDHESVVAVPPPSSGALRFAFAAALGAIGATWVAIGVTPVFFGTEFMSWRVWAQLVTFVGLGSALSWFGGWIVTRGDGAVRLVRAGLAALAAAGLVLAGFSSAQLVSWQIYSGGLGGELGWEWVLRALLLPLGCGLTVGLAAAYGYVRLER